MAIAGSDRVEEELASPRSKHALLSEMLGILQEIIDLPQEDPIEPVLQWLEGEMNKGMEQEEGTGKPHDRTNSRASELDDDSEGEAPESMPGGFSLARKRGGVAAEADHDDDEDWQAPVHEKSAGEREMLAQMIRTSKDSKLHVLFGNLPADTFEKIVDAMFAKTVAKGESVIELGAVGDFFYIVRSGLFDIIVQKGKDSPKKVFEAGAGFAFGELALLYNAPRSATVVAAEDSEVWCLERLAFRSLVVKGAERRFKERIEFLRSCDIFRDLGDDERAALADVLEEEDFEHEEAILEQGERDDKMFILKDGGAVACIDGENGEVEVKRYSSGQYFGEVALLMGEPRKASVYAVDKTHCLYVTRSAFTRVLGSLNHILERSIDEYRKYEDAIKASEAVGDRDEADESKQASSHRVRSAGVTVKDTSSPIDRLRKKAKALLGTTEVGKTRKAESSDGQDDAPKSLGERVAEDFKNEALVMPEDSLAVPGAIIEAFGGLRLGEHLGDEKVKVVRTALTPVVDGNEDIYSWNAPTKLKGQTSVAVLNQKGQKSEETGATTPNQDNFFVLNIGGTSVYGVIDGHGPFGHLVSFKVVQFLPHRLTSSPHWGKDWEKCLKESFIAAQADLLAVCAEHSINVEASGAAGSVLVFDEQAIHIAHIGDCRVFLGSWSRQDSRLIFETTDHLPEAPQERARLEAAGTEVREVGSKACRIYRPGSTFPGLTMSRAFGDTACAGVLSEPEYHRFLMQPSDEWYAIVASDGIWEFMKCEEALKLSAKKLRLKGPRETTRFLVEAARKRWAHYEDDYCDDITAILVQWNTKEKSDGGDNHQLALGRYESPGQ